MISGLLDGGSPELNSDERLLECLYAEDVARAYVEAAAASGEGRTIDSGRGVLTSVREIVQLIVESRRPVSGTSSTQHASSQELKVGCGGGHYRRRHSTQWLGGPTASPVGAWTHVALTYDGATLRLYIYGNQVATPAITGVVETNNNPLWIGGNEPYGEYFDGLIDDVRVYNRALTQADIQTDMNTPINWTAVPTLFF